MGGLDTDFAGEARLTQGFTAGYLPQDPQLEAGKTVLGIVQEGCRASTKASADEFEKERRARRDILARGDGAGHRAPGQAPGRDRGGRCLDLIASSRSMDALRCPPGDTDVAVISGGERRRVALCRILLRKPDLLLLDEPTNHLDAESVLWLENHLREYPGTVVAITHDRYFLDNVAAWILELDHGAGIPWHGNYSSWLDQRYSGWRPRRSRSRRARGPSSAS
ncbi:MAG: ATP-binding cassette domain-containing protein [Acidobacteriota bacterium]